MGQKLILSKPSDYGGIFDNAESGNAEYKLNVSIKLYWKEPPENTPQKIRREQIERIVQYKLEKWFSYKANCSTLLNIILNNED